MRAVWYGVLIAIVSACCWGGGPLDVAPVEPPDVDGWSMPSVAEVGGTISWDPWDDPNHGVSEAAYAGERRHLPQLTGLRARYDAAPARREAALTGVLLCRVLLAPGAGGDLLGGGPDLYLRLTAGSDVVATDEGEGDGLFSVPVHALASGSAVSLEVLDRDVFFDDDMGRADVVFDGSFPWHLDVAGERDGEVQCRAAQDTLTAREASAAVVAVDRALAALGTPRADLDEPTLGWPVAPGRAAHAAMRGLLALRGFQHPEVVARLEASAALASAMRADVGRAVSELREALPADGEPIALGAGLSGVAHVHCGAAGVPDTIVAVSVGSPCYVALDVVATAPTALDWVVLEGSGARWIDTSGHTAILPFAGAFHADAPDVRVTSPRALAAGERASLWWSAPSLTEGVVAFSFAHPGPPSFVRR